MEERAPFEAWARENIGQPNFSGRFIRDGQWAYNHNWVQMAWRCWQAAYEHAIGGDDGKDVVERFFS